MMVLLTAFVQLRRKAPPELRRLARFALIGLGLVLVGLLAEWEWVMRVAVAQGAILAPALWRLVLHAGAGILGWQAIVFLRVRGVPIGRLARAHGILIAVAGIAVVVSITAWRVLGAFPPYFSW